MGWYRIEVTEANFPFLRCLSEEFRFEALLQECESFEWSHGNDDSQMLSQFSILLGRLCGLEERHAQFERCIESEMQKVRSLSEKNEALEREVGRLSSHLSVVESEVSEQRRSFEAEQDYRRGCEYMFGTNGYGENGQELSKTLGFSHLKRSADLGHSDAQYRCGHCLLFGKGCSVNKREGARYLKLSADSHNSFAENQFSLCLLVGSGVVKDEVLATEYIKRSADGGNALGQNNFGYSLEHGLGIGKDLRLAAEYYKRSSEQDNSSGQANVGRCLVDGTGIAADPTRGAALVKRSADQGHSVAQYNYALHLEQGRGVEKDVSLAAHYYKLAMDQGDADAKRGYERCRS
jgi:TPR repeat protein